MEEEIEDIVGDVKLTDSQKSVATSNVYSMDFTDSSSDKNNSSGKDTYVIELDDSDDSDSYPIHEDRTVINLNERSKNKDADVQYEVANNNNTDASNNIQHYCVVSQEIFTQTSKTIFQLATEGTMRESLETQTSFVSITENKTFEYKIELSNSKNLASSCQSVLTNALDDESSKFQASDSETVKSENCTENGSDKIKSLLDEESKENILSGENQKTSYENMSDFEESNSSDMEQDSLMQSKDYSEIDTKSDISEPPQSLENEIEDLYSRLSETIELHAVGRYEPDKQYNRVLTPLTEESVIRRDSLIDITTENKHIENPTEEEKDILFTNFAGGKIKMIPLPKVEDKGEFKLPPIQNRSCPNSPHLNFLFSVHPSNRLSKSSTLPCVYEASERGLDRWEIGTKELASGESPLISGKSDPARSNGTIYLPPIHIEGYVVKSKISTTESQQPNNLTAVSRTTPQIQNDDINIKDKIKELKMTSKTSRSSFKAQIKYNKSVDSRSCSPSSGESESKLCDAVDRGCEALCIELLRRLHSTSWYEVSTTLEDIPKVMDKFWSVIAEHRVADLIRQVSAQVDSPRTQVARIACSSLACILKNTNYTKKPDFYEAVTLLLTKTGSFSRPVRRAANVALDTIVCGVELSHAVTALCVHGVDHKSPLVRCAAARLLVVSCALGGGGRELLRARPPTAVGARKHALRALAALLDDKSTDARKYAERLYTMLRPLANFEAYYLTDVEVELASRQMKKYDRLLFSNPPNDERWTTGKKKCPWVAASANVAAILEPNGLMCDDGKIPEGITLVLWELGRPLAWDATCADTLALSHRS